MPPTTRGRRRKGGSQTGKQKNPPQALSNDAEVVEDGVGAVDLGSAWVSKFNTTRVKRMMQENKDTGQISAEGLETMSQLIELFLVDIGCRLAKKIEPGKNCAATLKELRSVVEEEPLFDFIIPVLEEHGTRSALASKLRQAKATVQRKKRSTATSSIATSSKKVKQVNQGESTSSELHPSHPEASTSSTTSNDVLEMGSAAYAGGFSISLGGASSSKTSNHESDVSDFDE